MQLKLLCNFSGLQPHALGDYWTLHCRIIRSLTETPDDLMESVFSPMKGRSGAYPLSPTTLMSSKGTAKWGWFLYQPVSFPIQTDPEPT